MNELLSLSQSHKKQGIVVDTNILLLLIVGLTDVNCITSFKRTAQFTNEDYYVLQNALSLFDVHLVTPHILSEASNLMGHSASPPPPVLRANLRQIIFQCKEFVRESAVLAQRREFLQFGIADAGIAELATGGAVVLTDDSQLYHYLSGVGGSAVNFNHLRTYAKDL
ncbi:MAG: hypothetical protein HUU46_05115 [Candidatus Hydrogenedentes bacterium]|nr:hypothetical protein [Candidatus Hydrogenedentota bacterium]